MPNQTAINNLHSECYSVIHRAVCGLVSSCFFHPEFVVKPLADWQDCGLFSEPGTLWGHCGDTQTGWAFFVFPVEFA